MELGLRHREELKVCIIALLAALVLASNEVTQNGLVGVAGSYAYWIIRTFIEAVCFLAALYALERYSPEQWPNWTVYSLAILLSLVPFTLAITSFDLILGLPELGITGGSEQQVSRLPAFGKELIFLLDNHVSLCALLLLPRTLWRLTPADAVANEYEPSTDAKSVAAGGTFIDSLDPPLEGSIYWVEAQEHYVKLTTPSESRMVLYRFSDAIRELPGAAGMRVHRSHWVAFSAVKNLERIGQSFKLELKSGEVIPVSRSYRTYVEEKLQVLNGEE